MRFIHLFCAIVACGIALVFLFVGRESAVQVESRTIGLTAPNVFALKNQGLAFQRAALQQNGILPLYGSSELGLGPVEFQAGEFFRTAPLGFQVSPVGKPGTTSIIILQKLAALGGDLRGKRVAVSISPSWFFVSARDPYLYEGNFSLAAASETIFGHSLKRGLKQKLAARMLQFPRTLAQSPILKFAVLRLASGKSWDRLCYFAICPIGKLQNVILNLQDHLAAMFFLFGAADSPPVAHAHEIDWPSLISRATAESNPPEDKAHESEPQFFRHGGEKAFVAAVTASAEWADLKLLLRALHQMGAIPLLLSMPMDGQLLDKTGVSRSAREIYYAKIRKLSDQYNLALVDFEDHDQDTNFLERHRSHLSARGWIFYDRAIADFSAAWK